MNFKKELTGVAAKVAEIMEAELSAKQKAIAKLDHPKHKIDAGDLAKLRAGHKPVKEEQEQIDELSKETLSSYKDKVHGDIAKQYNKGDDNKLSKRLAGSAKASMRLAGVKPGSVKEEVVEEGIEDKIEAARKKAKAAGKKVEEPKKPAAPAKRKVEGGAYGGAKQKEKEEMEESVLPFTAMLESYTEHGLKAFIREQVEEEVQQEEVDNETFTKEVEDQKASMEGKKKQPKVAAAATQGVKIMDEEEQIDEKKQYGESDPLQNRAEYAAANKPGQVYKKTYKGDKVGMSKSYAYDIKRTGPKGKLPEEVEQIEERTLSEPETKKKEEYVKGMKKKLSGFKQRYGERAKEVMYATATRMAKEKK